MTEQENILRLIEAAGPIARTPFPEWCKKFAALVKAEAVAETREDIAGKCDIAAGLLSVAKAEAAAAGDVVGGYAAEGGKMMMQKLSTRLRAMAATPSREGEALGENHE